MAVHDDRVERPQIQRTGDRGTRVRVVLVVVGALLVVAVGLAGRNGPAPQTPLQGRVVPVAVVPTTLGPVATNSPSPVPSPVPPAVASPSPSGTGDTFAPVPQPSRPAAATQPGAAPYLVATVTSEGLDVFETLLTPDATGVYSSTVPLPASLRSRTGMLVVSVPPAYDPSDRRQARRQVAQFPVALDGRPFAPDSLAAVAEVAAGRFATMQAGWATVPDYAILASLRTDGRSVDMTIDAAPRGAGRTASTPSVGGTDARSHPTGILEDQPRTPSWRSELAVAQYHPAPTGPQADPCRIATTPFPMSAPDRSTNC
jgi:hypothetical protein